MKALSSNQMAIIRKDFQSVVSNKRLFPVLMVVPLVFTVILPTVFILITYFVPDDMGDFQVLLDMMPVGKQQDTLARTIIALIMNSIVPVFFIMIPIMASSVTAASSFVGEKEKKTLETLLYCPLPLNSIFQAKVWASFLLSMTVSVSSFIIMLIVVETEVLLVTGSMLILDISWLVVLLVVSPAVSLLAITLIVSGSAKSQTMEESQQRAVFLILPLLLLIFGQFAGIILINALYLLGVGAIFAVIAYILIKRAARKFTYEALLR
jgi:ABC-type Na+ efflux pump permease subunit